MSIYRANYQTTDVDPGDIEVDQAWDWVGLIVQSKRPFENGYARVDAGRLWVVTKSRGSLDLKSEPCGECGFSMNVSDVPRVDHEVERIMRYARVDYPESLKVDVEDVPWNEARKRTDGSAGPFTTNVAWYDPTVFCYIEGWFYEKDRHGSPKVPVDPNDLEAWAPVREFSVPGVLENQDGS
ncbi:MAG: hypothetical protein ABEN55_20385 [Bradymonadaceae bacterium]